MLIISHITHIIIIIIIIIISNTSMSRTSWSAWKRTTRRDCPMMDRRMVGDAKFAFHH
jgi:hypothetical protein